jgi:heme A synthase
VRVAIGVMVLALVLVLAVAAGRRMRHIQTRRMSVIASALSYGFILGVGTVTSWQLLHPQPQFLLKLLIFFLVFAVAGAVFGDLGWTRAEEQAREASRHGAA